MGDGEDGLVLELLSDGLLQQLVRPLVHAGRGLVDTQNLKDGRAALSDPVLWY